MYAYGFTPLAITSNLSNNTTFQLYPIVLSISTIVLYHIHVQCKHNAFFVGHIIIETREYIHTQVPHIEAYLSDSSCNPVKQLLKYCTVENVTTDIDLKTIVIINVCQGINYPYTERVIRIHDTCYVDIAVLVRHNCSLLM